MASSYGFTNWRFLFKDKWWGTSRGTTDSRKRSWTVFSEQWMTEMLKAWSDMLWFCLKWKTKSVTRNTWGKRESWETIEVTGIAQLRVLGAVLYQIFTSVWVSYDWPSIFKKNLKIILAQFIWYILVSF